MTPTRRDVGLSLAMAATLPSAAFARPLSTPLTAEQDHRRLLDLLGIDQLRNGADGWTPGSPDAANYDEALAAPKSPLPDPLTFEDGRPVASAADWPDRRREIAEHFEREIYGRVPASAPRVTWTTTAETRGMAGGIPVIFRTLAGATTPGGPVIAATLTLPADGSGPVPAVIALAFPQAVIDRFPPELGRPWREEVLARGRAVVEYVPTSVQADDGAGLAAGVIGSAGGGAPRGLENWGALRAWAWGAGRVLDHLETLNEIDADKICVFGLSRYGKAALVAMAFDTRFAAGFIASSGAGGAKLLRRDFGERVENLAGSGQYHWMSGSFLKYAGPLTADDLPVDAHQLITLCAPRPVFISSGTMEADRWTDPVGMFQAAVAAAPVYRLLGRSPLTETAFPMPLTLADGDLAFRQHEGGHTGGPNWPFVLDWLSVRRI